MTSTTKTTSPTIATNRNLRIAGLAAFGACAACCTLPLLAAAGLGGGLLSNVAGHITPGAELIVGGLAGISVLAILVVASRSWAATKNPDADRATDGGGCGCGPAAGKTIFTSPAPASDEPIVCTADLDDKPTVQAQLDGYRAVFAELRSTERFAGGFRWIFAPRPGLEDELRTLAEKEHQCCRFFEFDLRDTGESLVWEVRSDERAAGSRGEFAGLPTWLAQNPADPALLKQRASAAGLVFVADRAPAPQR